MRVAVVTLGSAGDLHPFLAVARALVERGHEVHLLSQAPYESAVRAEGVGFLPIASAADHERTLLHPLLWHPINGFGVLWRYLAVPAIGPTVEALDSLSKDGPPLTVFASPLAAGARLARERWPERMRLLSGYTAPMGLRSTADPMYLGAWRVPGWMPEVGRRGLWAALDRWKLEPMARPALNKWTDRLGLPALRGSLFGDALHSPDGGIALYPDWFAAAPQRWRDRGVQQTGFPVFEPSEVRPLAPAVVEFINDSRPYVVAYPGSADQRARTFADLVLSACKAARRRVLVLSQFRDENLASGDGVLWVNEAPLPHVLPRAAAFVHHGGIGSTAQGLAARVPQVVLASAYDQFENGERLRGLRAGWLGKLAEATPEVVRRALVEAQALAPRGPSGVTPSAAGGPNASVIETCQGIESVHGQR